MAIGLGLWHLYVVSGFASYSTLEVRITHLTVMLVLIFAVLVQRPQENAREKGTQASPPCVWCLTFALPPAPPAAAITFSRAGSILRYRAGLPHQLMPPWGCGSSHL
jgi:hypothetical protein